MTRARLTDQAGFTIVELLVACVVGVIVILAASSMLDLAPVLTNQVHSRVDTASRARLAMDQIARELRSQVCLGPSNPAIVSGQNSSVTFYDFTGSGAYVPQMHTIAWNAQTNTITDSTYVGTGTPPSMTFPSTPTSVETLLTDVAPEPATPMFSYYTFPSTPPVVPNVLDPTPVTGSAAANVARIAIRFVANSTVRPSGPQQSTDMQNDVYVRTWNPNDPAGPSTVPCI